MTNRPPPKSAQALFLLSDNLAGGFWQATKRRIKFHTRYWLTRSHLLRVSQHLHAIGLDNLITEDTRLALRPMRPYVSNHLSRAQRTHALIDHLDWLTHQFSLSEIQSFYASRLKTLFSLDVPEGTIRFVLLPGGALGREGEMEMHLRINTTTVMRTAFVVIRGECLGMQDGGRYLTLGNIQGRRNVAEAIKVVTQRMERTRPHNLMHTALQALVHAWQLQGLLGVADSHHVYSDYRSLSQRVGQSYDAVWQELGASEQPVASHWRLPDQWVPRDESEVPSSKRSQLRRKNAIRQSLFDTIATNARTLT